MEKRPSRSAVAARHPLGCRRGSSVREAERQHPGLGDGVSASVDDLPREARDRSRGYRRRLRRGRLVTPRRQAALPPKASTASARQNSSGGARRALAIPIGQC